MLIYFSLVFFRAFIDAAHSLFWCRDPILILLVFLKMLFLALLQICTRLFHLGKSIHLDSAWVDDFRLCQFSLFLHVLSARLAMRHIRVFGV